MDAFGGPYGGQSYLDHAARFRGRRLSQGETSTDSENLDEELSEESIEEIGDEYVNSSGSFSGGNRTVNRPTSSGGLVRPQLVSAPSKSRLPNTQFRGTLERIGYHKSDQMLYFIYSTASERLPVASIPGRSAVTTRRFLRIDPQRFLRGRVVSSAVVQGTLAALATIFSNVDPKNERTIRAIESVLRRVVASGSTAASSTTTAQATSAVAGSEKGANNRRPLASDVEYREALKKTQKYATIDLNAADDEVVHEAKKEMEKIFLANAKKPGDPDFVYDVQMEFSADEEEQNEWDTSDAGTPRSNGDPSSSIEDSPEKRDQHDQSSEHSVDDIKNISDDNGDWEHSPPYSGSTRATLDNSLRSPAQSAPIYHPNNNVSVKQSNKVDVFSPPARWSSQSHHVGAAGGHSDSEEPNSPAYSVPENGDSEVEEDGYW